MIAQPASWLERALALWLCLLLSPLSCVPAPIVAPLAGLVEYRSYGQIEVPGGFVDAVGGNLMLRGIGIAIDTPLGTQRIESTWNSASGVWQWSHRVRYDGTSFIEASGATLDASGVVDGAPIPGTGWTRVDATTLRTRGGLAWHFRPDGRLEHLRWSSLEYPRILFADSQISQCIAASSCAPLFTLVEGPNGQPRSVTEERTGRVALFDYDEAGRLRVARSPADVASGRPGTRYAYSGSQLVSLTSPEGERIEYSYQAGGRIRRVMALGEGNPAHVFDFYGRNFWGQHRTAYENPLGGHTTVYFDEARRVLRVELFEAGENRELAWQGSRPIQIVEADGATTELVWQHERIVSRTTPSGNVVTITHAAGGLSLENAFADPVLRVEDSLGLVEERSYDAAGRPIEVRNGAGESRALGWNGGTLASLETAGIEVSWPVFGVHGHWLDMRIAGDVVARRAFDPVGNETLPSDALRMGGIQRQSFDPDRRLARIDVSASDESGHLVANGSIDLTRRSDGEPTYIVRPAGGAHEFVHDALGRLVGIREYAESGWRESWIERDAMGNETARQLANGMRQEWDRDVYGRVIAHRASRHGVLEGEERFTWESGRIVARTDSLRAAGEVWAYDLAGRMLAAAFGYGETISYIYDARDRLVGEVYSVPGAGVIADIEYAYDAANRRTAIVDRLRGESLVEWSFADGGLEAIDTGNGLRRSFAYSANGTLISMQTRSAGGALVESSVVTREVALNPPRYEIRSVTATPLADTQEQYWLPPGESLANPDQRVGKRIFGWGDGSGAVQRYAWDEVGNRADTAQGDHFVYDETRSRLLSARVSGGEPVVYSYDAAGFTTSRDGVPLVWTASGRLARIGDDHIEWDMAGRMIALTQSGVTREFRLFGGRIESSLSTLGPLDLGDVVLDLGGAGRRWRHLDFRGQQSFVSDENGAVVAHYRYQPFGVDAGFGPEADAGRFENRAAFGAFYLLGARVLDPLVGRFLSPDPTLQLIDQYGYALGNPIGFEDADGLEAQARADLAKLADAIENGTKLAAAIALIASGGSLSPEVAIGLGTAYGVAAGIRLYLNLTSNSDAAAGPPQPGGWGNTSPNIPRITITDNPSSGCAPVALVAAPAAARRLLFGLLLLNALVAAWWVFEKRRESRCSRN